MKETSSLLRNHSSGNRSIFLKGAAIFLVGILFGTLIAVGLDQKRDTSASPSTVSSDSEDVFSYQEGSDNHVNFKVGAGSKSKAKSKAKSEEKAKSKCFIGKGKHKQVVDVLTDW